MKIFLIGLPGSGKSTLGNALAAALSLPFIDLDFEIEREYGGSIPSIFSEKGEAFFREMEAGILMDRIQKVERFVMATGGGAPCFHSGIDRMNEAGMTIFLDVPVDTLAKRMDAESLASRPLLADKNRDPGKSLSQLYESRVLVYRKASHVFSGDDLTVDELLAKIQKS